MFLCVLLHCVVGMCCYYVLSISYKVLPSGVIKNDNDDDDDDFNADLNTVWYNGVVQCINQFAVI